MRRYQNQRISARKATQKHGFRTEIQNELVREPRTKFLHFCVRKTQKPLQILVEMIVEYAFSTRKLGKLRPFQSKKLGAEAMGPTQTSRRRDLANPLGVEPLSL